MYENPGGGAAPLPPATDAHVQPLEANGGSEAEPPGAAAILQLFF